MTRKTQIEIVFAVQQQRRLIPEICQPIVDILEKDYIRLILAAESYEEYKELGSTFWRKLRALQKSDLAALPPDLHWKHGEPPREYLRRCYASITPATKPIDHKRIPQCQREL